MRSLPSEDDPEDDAGDEAEAEDAPVVDREIENFRGALKAATLALRIPIQIVWPTTYDNDAVVKRKLAEFSTRKVQDEATRAWNFFCALYYKAGGTPWRMIRDQRGFSATFMGVSFFEGLDGSSLQTSSAQLFDERGEGLILKGGPGLKDKTDRQPYLSAVDAFSLNYPSGFTQIVVGIGHKARSRYRETTRRVGFESLGEKAEGRSSRSGLPDSRRWLPSEVDQGPRSGSPPECAPAPAARQRPPMVYKCGHRRLLGLSWSRSMPAAHDCSTARQWLEHLLWDGLSVSWLIHLIWTSLPRGKHLHGAVA